MSEYVKLIEKRILNKVVADDPYVDVPTNGIEGIHYIPLEDIPVENRHTIRASFIYNEEEKKGYPEKPATFHSWVFDDVNMVWAPPIPAPTDGKPYIWDESIVNWKEFVEETTEE
jgi:hypothetical protein